MTQIALLLIDIQNDYFESTSGKWPLVGMETASKNAKRLLDRFRNEHKPIIHVRHEALNPEIPFFEPGTTGVDIYERVAPISGETVVVKHKANSFIDTDIQAVLQEKGITDLVVVGAMTQNCIDSTVRAAADLGYRVQLVEDACATKNLEFDGQVLPADQVQAVFMAALGFSFAKIVKTDDLMN